MNESLQHSSKGHIMVNSMPENAKFFILLMVSIGYAANIPCELKQVKGGIVCVCNSTHCDTVEPVEKLDDYVFKQYTSTKLGKRFSITYGSFKNPATCKRGTQITIRPYEKLQKIYGFGGAFTDAAGINIQSLSEKSQINLIRCYFSDEGIEINLCRVPIGGTDFSLRPYTLDDVPGDLKLQHFNLTEEDYKLKIPIIKKAKEVSKKAIHLIGSAWSAPTWMKTNGKITGYGFLKKEFYGLWAEYHVRFLEAYHAEGLDFWCLTTGNEPLNAYFPLLVKFNCMGWSPKDLSRWVADHLGPKIRSSNFKDVKIIAFDDQRLLFPLWAPKILSYKNSSDYIDGFGLHWYYDRVVPAFFIDSVHKKYPDKLILNTEACEGYLPWDQHVILGSWKRGQNYMESIIEDMNHWLSGWVEWNLALDEKGSPNWVDNNVDSPIIVNAEKDEFYKQPMFYAIGHFSKFVEPSATRIGLKIEGLKHISATAFYNENGSVVIIIHNRGSDAKCLILHDQKFGQAEVILEPYSFNTIIYQFDR